MSPELMNLIGLSANMIGVALAFKFGYPQPSHEEGASMGLEAGTRLSDGRTVAEHNVQIKMRKKRYLLWSRVGLAPMFVGFALQFGSTWQNWKRADRSDQGGNHGQVERTEDIGCKTGCKTACLKMS